MTIRDILIGALRRIGREELAGLLEEGGELGDGLSDEGRDAIQTLLYCVNATEDELARYYFPLKCTETLSIAGGSIKFSAFSHMPIRIIEVKAYGKPIDYQVDTNRLIVSAEKIEVTYNYTTEKKGIDDKSHFGDMLGSKVIEYGAAAEYCLICGEAALAETWETRYRDAVDNARRKIDWGAYIPPRRWV